jgi:hypothetical protein
MSPKILRRGRVIAFVLLLSPAACSVLLNTKAEQCSSDADCKKFSSTAVCQATVCVDPAATEAGITDGSTVLPDGTLPDGAPIGDAGCKPKTPVTQSDFLNEKCTNATCIPFDNCARLGVCDGSLPPLGVPDGGF